MCMSNIIIMLHGDKTKYGPRSIKFHISTYKITIQVLVNYVLFLLLLESISINKYQQFCECI